MSTIFIDSYRGHYTPDPPGPQTEKLLAPPKPAFGIGSKGAFFGGKTIKLYLCKACAKLQRVSSFLLRAVRLSAD
jgi:hypothetical protein